MKKIRTIILTIQLLLPSIVYAYTIDGLNSSNVIVYNKNDDVIIYEKNSNDNTSIASLTKIMTTIISIEKIKDLNGKVTITSDMLKDIDYDATVAGLSVGDIVTYEDLLYASMIPSGADATNALAISLSGSIDKFVDEMNAKARELNLTNTHFVNTTGLDQNGQKSTVRDVLTLLNYSLDNPTFKKVYETKTYTTTNNIKLNSTLSHYNEYLNYDLSFIKGSKTGFTDDAGLCLSTESIIDGTTILTVTTGAKYTYDGYYLNIKDIKVIKDSLTDDFTNQILVEDNETLTKLQTKYAKEDYIKIKSTKEISKYMEKPYNKDLLKIEYNGKNIIKYNTKKDTKVGTIKIYYNNELIEELDALTSTNLHFSLYKFLKTNILYITISFILLIILLKPKKKKIKKR